MAASTQKIPGAPGDGDGGNLTTSRERRFELAELGHSQIHKAVLKTPTLWTDSAYGKRRDTRSDGRPSTIKHRSAQLQYAHDTLPDIRHAGLYCARLFSTDRVCVCMCLPRDSLLHSTPPREIQQLAVTKSLSLHRHLSFALHSTHTMLATIARPVPHAPHASSPSTPPPESLASEYAPELHPDYVSYIGDGKSFAVQPDSHDADPNSPPLLTPTAPATTPMPRHRSCFFRLHYLRLRAEKLRQLQPSSGNMEDCCPSPTQTPPTHHVTRPSTSDSLPPPPPIPDAETREAQTARKIKKYVVMTTVSIPAANRLVDSANDAYRRLPRTQTPPYLKIGAQTRRRPPRHLPCPPQIDAADSHHHPVRKSRFGRACERLTRWLGGLVNETKRRTCLRYKRAPCNLAVRTCSQVELERVINKRIRLQVESNPKLLIEENNTVQTMKGTHERYNQVKG
ncbi:hypothetical protein R3P38DRAFT_2771268 [Favolaschia claudopus]|uniref:Uncharacterized protein n=1 Tax=Favolaschia claudopus TaxID=2862362 RepID=A0AAW0CA70_9AGAR